MIILFSCEKKDDEIVKNEFKRKSFLIINDTINCNYVNYDSKILNYEKDSIDLNFDSKNDMQFITEVLYIDDCEDFLVNCPPDVLCDCWPYWETNFYLNLPKNVEITVDLSHNVENLNLNDTLSNQRLWIHKDKILIHQCRYVGGEFSPPINVNVGLRTMANEDTMYSYIKMLFEKSRLKINSIVTQK